jgi:hypothetical protein
MADDDAWAALREELRPHVSPEWHRYAHEHGDQPWVRLVLLVDAHAFLVQPRIAEKIGMTMADLADEREDERAGWQAIVQTSQEDRTELVTKVVDTAELVLPETLTPLFARSIEPSRAMM